MIEKHQPLFSSLENHQAVEESFHSESIQTRDNPSPKNAFHTTTDFLHTQTHPESIM